jgi:hypothetical protein
MDLGLSQTTIASARARLGEKIFPGDANNAAFLTMVNEVIERFHNQERWIASLATFRVDVSEDKTFYLPYFLDSINSAILDERPGIVQGPRYEFVHDGPGLVKKDSGISGVLVDLGLFGIPTTFPMTDEDVPIPSTLTFSAVVAADIGKKIRVLGYDTDGNWITDTTGSPGEEVTLAGTAVVTTNTFKGIKGIQKEITTKPVTITHTTESKLLVRLESSMENPLFRGYRVLDPIAKSVLALCKRRPIPVNYEEDYIYPGDLSALKLGMLGILYEEASEPNKMQQYFREALDILNASASSHMGGAQEQTDFNPWGLGVGGVSSTS